MLLNRLLLSRTFFLSLLLVASASTAQPPPTYSAAEIQLALQKLSVLGSVLHVGAHPDDENNALIAYFARDRLLRTAYLSATRGDGGQNHIGTEQGELLGILRTQELLAARRLDGGEQYFSRAVDFGYTVSVEETFRKWDKEAILADFVRIIRTFKPDVLITRFPTTGEGRHGHHTASAILAVEAFAAAADPKRFPEQLESLDVWQAKRLLWNAWPQIVEARGDDPAALLRLDFGAFNPLLGLSYTEIGAEARSLHKCQGMGTAKSRGPAINYFQHLAGDSARFDPLDGIETGWSRIAGSDSVAALISRVQDEFQPGNPAASVPLLAQIHAQLQKLPPSYWVEQKIAEVSELIHACSGFWFEATSRQNGGAPGSQINISATVINRSAMPMTLRELRITSEKTVTARIEAPLHENEPRIHNFISSVPDGAPYSNPYWLRQPADGGRFVVADAALIGQPENDPVFRAIAVVEIDGHLLEFVTPVQYRWTDELDGDRYQPFAVVPEVTVNAARPLALFPDDQARTLTVRLRSGAEAINGMLIPRPPRGWRVRPERVPFRLALPGDELAVEFEIRPPKRQNSARMRLVVDLGGRQISHSLRTIDYRHVPVQRYFPPAQIDVVRVEMQKHDEKIGYVMGAGDEVPQALRQVGYDVTLLSDDDLEQSDLSRFDVIITGVRAYNSRERLRNLHKRLLAFAEAGGTLIVQYSAARSLLLDDIGPYPMRISSGRVTEEQAPVELLAPQHHLLNKPNKISKSDFDDWVQERGLYFAADYDQRYQTILSSQDSGGEPLAGGLLYARYGKGVFIYTGYAWFRQLPAGVPGAFRLFANLISAGRYAEAADSRN